MTLQLMLWLGLPNVALEGIRTLPEFSDCRAEVTSGAQPTKLSKMPVGYFENRILSA
jgi:hypothetical protein